jgi:hypothetical protein
LTEVLGDEVMAAALIDHIVHHCHRSISAVTAIDCASRRVRSLVAIDPKHRECAVKRNGEAMAKSPTVVSEFDPSIVRCVSAS